VLPILVERFRRDDRAEAAPSPGGNGGTWDLNVLGNGHGATTNDVFAKAMVVGASCPRRVRDGGCHPRRITCTSENLNDIEEAALANKKFRMSAYTAAVQLDRVDLERGVGQGSHRRKTHVADDVLANFC
jgi:hypothetical protein